MAERSLTFFASDVHLGLDVSDPADREARFVRFLRSVPADRTAALYLLGVFSALVDLMYAGVKVCFFQGNHDVWTYSYFEELGMVRLEQPAFVTIGGKSFCLGHGDGLGPVPAGYRFLRSVFHCRPLQVMFSMLHPWIAFRLGNGWSRNNRLARHEEYVFRGEDEPLYKFACEVSESRHVDYFVFGHYHADVRMTLPSGAELIVLKDWIDGSPYLYFDGISMVGGYCQKSE